MTYTEAKQIVGDRATWELHAMKRALSALGGFLNTQEENRRLVAIKLILRLEGKNGRTKKLHR